MGNCGSILLNLWEVMWNMSQSCLTYGAGEPEYVCTSSCLSLVEGPSTLLWLGQTPSEVANLHGNGECWEEMEGALFLLLMVDWNHSVPRHSSKGLASSLILELVGSAWHLQVMHLLPCCLKWTKDLKEVLKAPTGVQGGLSHTNILL